MELIKLQNVSKIIHGKILLDNVNLTINKGDIAILKGVNGSGKTLILKSILGLIRTKGDVWVDKQKVDLEDAYPIRAGILIENPSLIENFSAEKNMQLLADLQKNVGSTDIATILKKLRLTASSNQKVKNFSLGMKQKLGIAQALLGENPLIVLDEPTNALDEDSVKIVIKLIKELNTNKGVTFVIASHDSTFINNIATRIFNVSEGQVDEK